MCVRSRVGLSPRTFETSIRETTAIALATGEAAQVSAQPQWHAFQTPGVSDPGDAASNAHAVRPLSRWMGSISGGERRGKKSSNLLNQKAPSWQSADGPSTTIRVRTFPRRWENENVSLCSCFLRIGIHGFVFGSHVMCCTPPCSQLLVTAVLLKTP